MPEAALPPLPNNFEFSVLARHAEALPARQRWLFFGILAGFSLSVGLTLTLWGAWPVLPYSIGEMTVLWIAFRYVERRARDWERLTIAQDRVIIERSAGGRHERREFNRRWVQVELEDNGVAWWRQPRLALRFAGSAVEFRGALPAGERARLARELRRLLAAQ